MKTLAALSEKARDKAQAAKQPSWISPMLARLTHERFSDRDWLYERKFDGERCLSFIDGGRVRMLSRNRKKLNDTYPELVDALSGEKEKHLICDGEIVAFEGRRTSFSRLQNRMHLQDPGEARATGVKVYYYIFDILYAGRYDLRKVPLSDRKKILKKIMRFSGPLRYTVHRRESGEDYYRQACEKGWEGVIAKDGSAGYAKGRSSRWLKFKCTKDQEFIIGGYTDPQGSRTGFGGLLLGYYKKGKLRYAGKVGTGFSDMLLSEMPQRLKKIERKTCPFSDTDTGEKDAHWVEPKLVGQVGFAEWTGDGKLRHPRFKGLRDDKAAKKVRREA